MKDNVIRVRINTQEKSELMKHIREFHPNMSISEFIMICMERQKKIDLADEAYQKLLKIMKGVS